MILNATHHHGVIDPQVIVAALGAAAFLYARFKVTPVADPKDGNGQPLVAPFLAAPRKTLLPPAVARGTDISPLADPPMEDLPGPVLPPAAPE
jgi:hypothetical protein